MTTNKKITDDTNSDVVTDVNQVINSTNTQRDYYTPDLLPDENGISTTATSGLDDIVSEGDEVNLTHPYIDDIDLVDNPPDNSDGLNTTTDTTRFLSGGGVVSEEQVGNEEDNPEDAMHIIHPVDEGTV